jgi:predicted GIY-YIG superfamily endonuclease
MGQRFVYILRSDSKPDAPYIGVTSDVSKRLWWHNNGPDGYTRRHRPWRLVVAVECEDEAVARRFERYLKSGSGQIPGDNKRASPFCSPLLQCSPCCALAVATDNNRRDHAERIAHISDYLRHHAQNAFPVNTKAYAEAVTPHG